MGKHIDWYFDFLSPFAYLQHERFMDLPANLEIHYKPVLLAGLLNHWENRGPAEIPAKRLFTYRFVQWQAAQRGIEMRFPPAHPFNPLPALRLALVCDNRREAVRAIFRYLWREGKNLEDRESFAQLCAALGVTAVEEALADPAIKDRLRANGREAIERNVFGVPTFWIDDHLFWGVDATEMLLDFLAHPGLFEGPEMKRLATIPVAASRI